MMLLVMGLAVGAVQGRGTLMLSVKLVGVVLDCTEKGLLGEVPHRRQVQQVAPEGIQLRTQAPMVAVAVQLRLVLSMQALGLEVSALFGQAIFASSHRQEQQMSKD